MVGPLCLDVWMLTWSNPATSRIHQAYALPNGSNNWVLLSMNRHKPLSRHKSLKACEDGLRRYGDRPMAT
jgi:hypothetical protein